MKLFISLSFLFTCFSGICQDDYIRRMYPNFGIIQNLPIELTQHIPAGFAAMDTVSGDLNKDKYRDMIMILKQTDEDTIYSRDTKRPLLLFTGQPDGSLQLAAQNDNVVYCIGCGGMVGDPYQGIVIKNGYFSIEYYGGAFTRWMNTVTFKYSSVDKDWILHKRSYQYFRVDDPDNIETEIETDKDFGKVILGSATLIPSRLN